MGLCQSTKKEKAAHTSKPDDKQDITDENVQRIKQQFDELAKLLEDMSQEFKSITDGIIKLQQKQYQQIED